MNAYIASALLYTIVSSLHAVLLGVMALRRLYREYPFFFAYTAAQVTRGVALYWLMYLAQLHRATFRSYFLTYWIGDAVTVALSFMVVYRIFGAAFRDYPRLHHTGRALFAYGGVGLLAAAVVMAAVSPGADTHRFAAGVLLLERSTMLIRCGLLLLVFAATAFLSLSWRDHVFGMALGFGLWSGIDLALMAIRAQFGAVTDTAVTWLMLAGYGSAVIIWFVYFVFRRRGTSIDGLPQVPLAWWNAALEQVVQR